MSGQEDDVKQWFWSVDQDQSRRGPDAGTAQLRSITLSLGRAVDGIWTPLESPTISSVSVVFTMLVQTEETHTTENF